MIQMRFSAAQRLSRHLGAVIFVLGLAFGLYAYGPTFVNPYVIADDIRITAYWVPQYHDAALFSDDLLTRYAKYHEPWGYHIIYYLGAYVFDPINFGTGLTVFLLALLAYYTFKLLDHLGGAFAGILGAVCVLLSMTFVSNMAGGMPRSFAFPLGMGFLYYLISGRQLAAAVMLITMCLFHPMIFLIASGTYALSLIRLSKNKRPELDWTGLKYFVPAFAVCAAMLLAKYAFVGGSEFGEAVNMDYIKTHPEYFRGVGRYHLYPLIPVTNFFWTYLMASNAIYQKLFQWTSGLTSLAPFVRGSAVAGVAGALYLLLVLRGKIRSSMSLLYFLIVSVVLYLIAEQLLLKLYIPSKYLRHSVPILGLVLFVSLAAGMVKWIPNRWGRGIFQILLLVWVIFPFQWDRSRYYIDETAQKPLYDFLATLPKSTIIAAHPDIADNIPLFSQRKVYVNYETANPIYRTYWEEVKKRTAEFFHAYYAEDIRQLIAFCQRTGVEYFVVDPKHFQDAYLKREKIYFYPFHPFVKSLVEGREKFVLMNIPEKDRMFTHDGTFVIHRDALLRMLLTSGQLKQ